jgi:hypothetical protein
MWNLVAVFVASGILVLSSQPARACYGLKNCWLCAHKAYSGGYGYPGYGYGYPGYGSGGGYGYGAMPGYGYGAMPNCGYGPTEVVPFVVEM